MADVTIVLSPICCKMVAASQTHVGTTYLRLGNNVMTMIRTMGTAAVIHAELSPGGTVQGLLQSVFKSAAMEDLTNMKNAMMGTL